MKLVRLSEDGTHLVLTHEGTGEEFALRIDDRVRGAVVSDRARIGQLPMERPSRLRPKEIQARLRAGESSEDIAAAADVPLERILRYAGPVLAEREYIAEQARRCALRRQPGGTAGKTLEQVAGDRLETLGLDLERAEWDAWRAADGRWAVSVTYTFDGEHQRAVFSYDPLGRLVVPSDDAAREMVEGPKEQPVGSAAGPSVVHGPAPRTPRDGRLRLAPVPAPTPGATPEVYAGDPDTGRSASPSARQRPLLGNTPPSSDADVRPLRPADSGQPAPPAARGHSDLTEVDLDAIDGEDTVDLSRTFGRQPLKPLQPADPQPTLRSEPRRDPQPPREPEPAPEVLPDLLDVEDAAEPAMLDEPEAPAPSPEPAAEEEWLPEELLQEVRTTQPQAPEPEERPAAPRPVPAPPPSKRAVPTPPRETAKPKPQPVERVAKSEPPVEPAEEKPVEQPLVEAVPDPEPDPEPEPEAEQVSEPAAEAEPEPEPERSVRRPKPANANAQRKRAARSSRKKGAVPSWDDILFGGGKK